MGPQRALESVTGKSAKWKATEGVERNGGRGRDGCRLPFQRCRGPEAGGYCERISQREGATGEGKGLDLEDPSSGKGWRPEDSKGWEAGKNPGFHL